MFNTYIINLEKDKEEYKTIRQNLKEVGIKPYRYNAVYGKKLNLRKKNIPITTFGRNHLPYSVIGVGLSHIYLNKYIYENDKNDYALILEDDMVPIFKNKKEISKIIKQAPKDWEIILLYCQGMCYNILKGNWTTTVAGGAAAYIVNKKGQKKMKDIILSGHIDLQRNSMFKEIYVTPKQFFKDSEDHESSTSNTHFQYTLSYIHYYICYLGYKLLNKLNIKQGNIDAGLYKIFRLEKKEFNYYDIASIMSCINLITILVFKRFNLKMNIICFIITKYLVLPMVLLYGELSYSKVLFYIIFEIFVFMMN